MAQRCSTDASFAGTSISDNKVSYKLRDYNLQP